MFQPQQLNFSLVGHYTEAADVCRNVRPPLAERRRTEDNRAQTVTHPETTQAEINPEENLNPHEQVYNDAVDFEDQAMMAEQPTRASPTYGKPNFGSYSLIFLTVLIFSLDMVGDYALEWTQEVDDMGSPSGETNAGM